MKAKRRQVVGAEISRLKRGHLRARPYVFVTPNGPDDGGDFGRSTPRTRTGGLQEALDYAHENFRDVYVWGGRGGVHGGVGTSENVYTLSETLRVPWNQDFRMDGGHYVLAYTPKTGPAVSIDSQMNCKYKFGLIVSKAPDAAVQIKPQSPGPDDFLVITASEFEFAAPVSGNPDGVGVLVDSSKGPIINSKIFSEEINSQGRGVYLSDNGGKGKWISNNLVQVMYGNQYHAVGDSVGLQVGEEGSDKIVDNRIEMSLHAPAGSYWDDKEKVYKMPADFTPPENSVGADIFAQGNVLTLAFYGKRSEGKDLVFEPDSSDNTVFALNLPNGYTNKSGSSTNKIVANWPVGFQVQTPDVPPSGSDVMNLNSFTVSAIITYPGKVSSWTLTEAQRRGSMFPRNLTIIGSLTLVNNPTPIDESGSERINSGFHPGQMIILDPGDRLGLVYTEPPKWRWKALR